MSPPAARPRPIHSIEGSHFISNLTDELPAVERHGMLRLCSMLTARFNRASDPSRRPRGVRYSLCHLRRVASTRAASCVNRDVRLPQRLTTLACATGSSYVGGKGMWLKYELLAYGSILNRYCTILSTLKDRTTACGQMALIAVKPYLSAIRHQMTSLLCTKPTDQPTDMPLLDYGRVLARLTIV